MPKLLTYIFYLCFVFTASILLALSTKSAFSQHEKTATTPVPDYLTSYKNQEVTTLDLWKPSVQTLTSGVTKPQLTAKEAYMYDLTTDQVLFSQNINQRVPMASLTKIMTAIVSLENPKADDQYVIQPSNLVGEDSMGLDSGEVLTQKELLYGLILHSANDAAETLAGNYQDGRFAFITAMNDKVKTLGLQNSHFTNPTGLEGDGNQYSSAYDLLIMTRYALTFPTFVEVAKTFDYSIPKTDSHKKYDLENETNLLTSYPGVEGVKTGYTPEAGYCLVTYLNYHGHQIIGVLLGSEDRRNEMKALLDYSLKTEGITPPEHD